MQTNFFSQINQLDISGTLKLVVAKKENGQLIVSILMDNVQCTNKERKTIPPLNLSALPEDLDRLFFDTISEPVNQTAAFFTSRQQYMKSLTTAKSKSENDGKQKGISALTPKEKKYKDLMEQSQKLEAEGKFKEAWTKLPDPLEYPDQAELIRNKRQALSEKFAPDLFASFDDSTAPYPVKDTEPEPEETEIVDNENDDLEYNEYAGLETEDQPEFDNQ
ncbi:hypothetical protein [Sphingobacterium siyangense]|uniref:hypothetical protein n=1 Tax=Sphingobacterium siyangense TaxID=459529 RepID=UPI003DA4967F